MGYNNYYGKSNKKDLKVSVDFDEVLYDLHKAHNIFLEKNFNISLERDDITYWDYLKDNFPEITSVWSNWDLYSTSSLIKGALDFMAEVNDMFRYENVTIVTASHPNIMLEKSKALNAFFPNNKHIHSTHDKYLHTENTILIDDNVKNIKEHVFNNKRPGIIFGDYGWNKENISAKDIYKANSYEKVLEQLETFLKVA